MSYIEKAWLILFIVIVDIFMISQLTALLKMDMRQPAQVAFGVLCLVSLAAFLLSGEPRP